MSIQNILVNFDKLLLMAIGSDSNQRNEGMNSLNNLANSNLSLFLKQLGAVLSDESKPKEIRQLSAILIKNTLTTVDGYREKWKNELPPEEKKEIKLFVLSTLASSLKEIRTIASTVISSICKIDSPITQTWPDLLPSLIQNAFNKDINLKLSAIEALGYVCEEITIKSIGESDVDKILTALIQNLKDDKNSVEVSLQVLKALYYSIRLAEKNFKNKNERAIIMDSIFQIGEKYITNMNILEQIAMLFIEMLSVDSYYDYIEDYFEKIISFSFTIINNYKTTNEKLALLGLEIICSIGDEELARNNSGIINLAKINQNFMLQKVNKGYLTKKISDLQKLIVANVTVPDDDEDENEWNISKACLYILNILVQTVQPQAMGNFYLELSTQIKNTKDNNNLNERAKCWLLLGSLITQMNKMDVLKIISSYFQTIFEDIKQNVSIKLKKCASYLIYKITKIIPKIFEQSKLGQIIDVLSLELKNCKDEKIVGKLCQSLQNIIKTFGDLDTNKSSCVLSNFFEKIFTNIYRDALNDIKDIIEGKSKIEASCSRLMTIGTLIEYSSHDKQTQIYEIIKYFLIQIEKIQNEIENLFKAGATKETVFQIQEYYYSLLQKLFIKYKSEINYEFAHKIWQLTETLFKFRQSVFDEANLALAALARNMKKKFIPIFSFYYPYIVFSIKSYQNKSLSKTGLLSLLHCISSTEDTIEKTEDMIKILMDVCNSNDVSRDNKTIAINIMGILVFFYGINFKNYLEPVMKVLFSAAKFGINISDDSDEDIIEFVKSLRYELIQTFTSIELSFNDKENSKYLTPFIQDLFLFLQCCVEDTKKQTLDILKSILNLLIDLFGIYGGEFKKLCNENFVANFIKKIYEYIKNENLDPELEQNIDILKSYFINKS